VPSFCPCQDFPGLFTVRAAAHIQVDLRRGNAQIAEKDIGHFIIVVLAGMDEDFSMATADGFGHRRGLNELRTRPNDGHDFHQIFPV